MYNNCAWEKEKTHNMHKRKEGEEKTAVKYRQRKEPRYTPTDRGGRINIGGNSEHGGYMKRREMKNGFRDFDSSDY